MSRPIRGALTLRQMFRELLRAFGPQSWWPGESPFEVMVGAILTQRTRWHNADQALRQLKQARLLAPRALASCPTPRLRRLIRSAGYYRQKTARLSQFSRWLLVTYGGQVERLFAGRRTRHIREELLGLSGIGPETADTMLLYAGKRPVAVVDEYARRILRRHRVIQGDEPYDTMQTVVLDRLPRRASVLNEWHALIVEAGKRFCFRTNPDCAHCPLGAYPRTIERSNSRWRINRQPARPAASV